MAVSFSSVSASPKLNFFPTFFITCKNFFIPSFIHVDSTFVFVFFYQDKLGRLKLCFSTSVVRLISAKFIQKFSWMYHMSLTSLLSGVLLCFQLRSLVPAEHLFQRLNLNNLFPFKHFVVANDISCFLCYGIIFNPIQADKHSGVLKSFSTTGFINSQYV